jgi:AraC family transcriptional regulator
MRGDRGEVLSMEPTFIEKGQLLLAGLGFFGDPFTASREWTAENEIGRVWQRFMTYQQGMSQIRTPIINPEVAYEVHIEHPETRTNGYYEIFVGQEIGTLEAVPVELLIKVLPPARYAMFTLQGQAIVGDWPQMVADWLAQAGYQQAAKYGFQRYDRRFKGLDRLDESALDIYVPITPI